MRGHAVSRALVVAALLVLPAARGARAQDGQDTQEQPHDMSHMHVPAATWTFMQDGVFNALFNHQGGAERAAETKGTNWWMGMLSRRLGSGRLMLTAMLSLEPATVGRRGYRELFQSGEAIDGRPNVDRQHPHDAFMQISAAWTVPLTGETGVTLVGAPVGEPALGPVAFMHRASAAGLVLAPLSHHTFDSTHVAFGVITAGVTRRRWTAEGSVFNGREPDANRWDFDFGRLDSVSGRLWFRPTDEWAVQVSSGHLVMPEELESGNVVRTTTSASWTRLGPDALTALTVGYGRNDPREQQAAFGEMTWQRRANMLSSRLEIFQAEASHLSHGNELPAGDTVDSLDAIATFTIGAVRRIGRWRALEGGLGMNATAYIVPTRLHSRHGTHPASVQLFFQVRPRVGGMGPMWNMRMGE